MRRAEQQEKPYHFDLAGEDCNVQAGVGCASGVLVEEDFGGGEFGIFFVVCHLLLVFGVRVLGVLQQVDDGFYVALSAEFQKRSCAALLRVRFQIHFLGKEGQDVEVGLGAAFVVQRAEDLLGAGGGDGADVRGAGGALED